MQGARDERQKAEKKTVAPADASAEPDSPESDSPEPTADGAATPTEADGDPERPEFEVNDRRFWAREASAGDADDEPRRPEKPAYVAELEQKLAEKEARLQEYVEAHRSAQRQFEEARQRIERDVERQVQLGRDDLVTRFFDVLDNLDRSLQAAEDSAADEQEKGHAKAAYDALREGVRMVHAQLSTVLESLGLERIDPEGDPFDPELHDAMSLVPVTDPEQDNVVQQVFRPGYRRGDRVLRPATVLVGRHQG